MCLEICKASTTCGTKTMRGWLITISSEIQHIIGVAVTVYPLAMVHLTNDCNILLDGDHQQAVGLILLAQFPCFHGQKWKRDACP